MADDTDDLTFAFGADFAGLTRAAEGAGRTLDALGRRVADWSDDAATSLRRPFDGVASGPLQLTDAMARAREALRTPAPQAARIARGSDATDPAPASGGLASGVPAPPVSGRPAAASPASPGQALSLLGSPSPSVAPPVTVTPAPAKGDDDATAAKELAHLADQLALLKSTGAAHDAIVERIKIETEQAKLGTDATEGQKQAVAGLVVQIDAAKAAQTALKQEQSATDAAWRAGSGQLAQGLESLILDGARLGDVLRSALSSVARQGLNAALTGTGSFAGLFGTASGNGRAGGLFGAVETLFSGGLGASGGSGSVLGGLFGGGGSSAGPAADARFAGLYANGGTLQSGQWGIVGERGAEVVAGPATVVPVGRMAPPGRAAPSAGATHQTINFNVTSPDSPSFARSETQMSALLSRLVARGQRNG